jgi:hypothetical protein
LQFSGPGELYNFLTNFAEVSDNNLVQKRQYGRWPKKRLRIAAPL